jgi:indole-3-glycerol phosphate synthase
MTTGIRPTASILDRIVQDKLGPLEERKRQVPEATLSLQALSPTQPLSKAIVGVSKGPAAAGRVAIVAEIKKASPSKGQFVSELDPVSIARSYAAAGAVGISIVTEANYFQGDLRWLREVRFGLENRPGSGRPSLLRKDFITDPYELTEARAFGADNILLIVAMLDDGLLKDLMAKASSESLEPLVEVHNEEEAERAVRAGAHLFGINNRDLHTFAVDLGTTERIRPFLPADAVVIAESGVGNRADADRLVEAGVDAILVGESLMLASDVKAKMDELRL